MTLTPLQNLRKASRRLPSVLALTTVLGVGGCLVGAVPTQAERQDAKDDTTYTIKRVYKPGETDRYQVTTKVRLDSPAGARDAVMIMRIKDSTTNAKEDGTYTSISEFESASITSSGTNHDLTAMMPKVITTHDKTGKSDVKMEGGNEDVNRQLGEQIKQFTLSAASVYLPPKPVKVGETWDMTDLIVEEIDPDDPKSKGEERGRKIKGKVTLVSVDTVDGVKVGKFRTISNITLSKESKLHTEATTLLDMTTGKPLSFTSKSEGTTAIGKVNTEMELKMLGTNDKGDAQEATKTDSDVKKP